MRLLAVAAVLVGCSNHAQPGAGEADSSFEEPTDSGALDTAEAAAEIAVRPDCCVDDFYAPLAFIHAAPTVARSFFCVGLFKALDDPAAVAVPFNVVGPVGVPDPDKPTDPNLVRPIAYGEHLPGAISRELSDVFGDTGLVVVAWRLPEEPRVEWASAPIPGSLSAPTRRDGDASHRQR